LFAEITHSDFIWKSNCLSYYPNLQNKLVEKLDVRWEDIFKAKSHILTRKDANKKLWATRVTATEKIEGHWNNSTLEGYGLLQILDDGREHQTISQIYEGFFQNGALHGIGMYRSAKSNETYFGDWQNGKRHGKGTMLYRNEMIFEGSWQNNRREGEGVLCFGKVKYKAKWENDSDLHGKFYVDEKPRDPAEILCLLSSKYQTQ